MSEIVQANRQSLAMDPERDARRIEPRHALILTAILVGGVLLRLYWNDVAFYSPADEAVYTNTTRYLVSHGWHSYPEVAREYLQDSRRWVYPGPLRWGNYLLTVTICRVMGRCEARSLAWLSTVSGIAALILTFLLAKRLFDRNTALLAALFTSTSPLQLALGRRALQDELVIAMFLLDVLLLLSIVERRRKDFTWLYPATISALTLSLGVKESFVLFFAVFAVLFLARRAQLRLWRVQDLALFGLPPLLYLFISSMCVGGLQRFVEIAKLIPSYGLHSPAALQFQGGWFHRVLVDFFLVEPLICIAAIGACWMVTSNPRSSPVGAVSLAVLTAALVTIFFLLSSKNLRYYAVVDSPLRILAAWTLIEHQFHAFGKRKVMAVVVIAAICSLDLALFHHVFISGAVYDPVTLTLTRALGLVPR